MGGPEIAPLFQKPKTPRRRGQALAGHCKATPANNYPLPHENKSKKQGKNLRSQITALHLQSNDSIRWNYAEMFFKP
jgi:hypothetical protein